MCEYEYVGCFFDYNELSALVENLRKNPLKNNKTNPHVTFEYHPEVVNTLLFGAEITAEITGYGNDGENEGLCVRLLCSDKQLSDMAARIEKPHITLAVSDSGQAVNTRFLEFEEITPLRIVGKYGGWEY